MPLLRNTSPLPLTVAGVGRAEPGETLMAPAHLASGLTNPPWEPVDISTAQEPPDPPKVPAEEE